MPSSVVDIFAAAGATPAGVVRWGQPPALPGTPDEPATGIYAVALTDRAGALAGTLPAAPLSGAALHELLALCPELTLDRGARPTPKQLAARLAAFWFPDEVVVYIGLADARRRRPPQGELAARVGEFYATALGANGPHAGGWPLKTLACLNELHVHYAYCENVDDAERACIGRFAEHVSPATRAALHDPVRVMPFANLEFPKGNRKDHGIRGARVPKTKRAPKAGAAPAASQATRWVPVVTAPHRSLNVTANDIAVGQVRIPIGATKRILPATRQDVTVLLRGRELTCRWDPRYGDKERSGVIRVGTAATAHLAVGDALDVSVSDDGAVRLG